MPTTISTGITTTAVLPNSVQTLFDSKFALAYAKARIWLQEDLVTWFPDQTEANGGTIKFDVFGNVAPATTALTETVDPDPVTMSNGVVTITPTEQGNAIGLTKKLRAMAFEDIADAATKVTANNQAQTLDYLVRAAVLSTANTYRQSGNALRTGLDATNDKVTTAFLASLVAQADGWGMMPYDGNMYVSIVPPSLRPDIMGDATWLATSQYSKASNIFNGEVGALAGVRFIFHRYGKTYLGGGTTAQSATTVATTNVAAGDTAVTVASATGIAVGDYLTLGTLEAADAEQVLVTAVSGADLTIRGKGNVEGNAGVKFAHLIGAAVTEAANVAAIPIIGEGGVYGVASSLYGGKMGSQGLKSKDTYIPDRFQNTWWQWFGGFAIRQGLVLVGEVAVSGGIIDSTLGY